MNAKKRGLGRGLEALLGPVSATDDVVDDRAEELRTLPVELLQRGANQPRLDFDADALQELADSISAQGVLQPVLVRPLGRFREV